jgi:DNA processing protein
LEVVPNSPEELLAELRLALTPGVGPLTHRRLLDYFSSAAAAMAATESELRDVEGVGPKLAKAIRDSARSSDAERELTFCKAHGISLLVDSDPRYPRDLREIPDPPGILFARGELIPQDALGIAIVGTRHATTYGLDQAEKLAGGLSRAGLTIISGLARGIDACAHRAALAAGGRTVAILGSGVMNIYPPEHDRLAEEVIAHGALLSEHPPQSPPLAGAFPQRNRIITGMSLGVIVVEANLRSGALISARHAMEQGREVFAVPGRVDSRTSQGCHRLIRDGAKLVECVDDVLEELGPLSAAVPAGAGDGEVRHPGELVLNDQEQVVLQAIESSPTTIEQVIAACELPVQRVLATISVLEMRKLVRRLGANTVQRR